jgi:hypothetical protein
MSQSMSQKQVCTAEVLGKLLKGVAGPTGLEPATSDVTGQRSNQLNYDPANSITNGGRCRDRTSDLILVRDALSQLS